MTATVAARDDKDSRGTDIWPSWSALVGEVMLEQGRLPVETIAKETGFGDRERMRRAFLRASGQTPQAIRNASHPLASF
jgi:methylphosphotriester-DNA--protein-cysteine methyltransferase